MPAPLPPVLLVWRGFVRAAAGAGGAVLARTGGALVLNKLLAVYGGPGGLTLLAQFQNLMALLATLPNEGVHVGLVKYLAPLRPGSARHRAWLGAAVLLSCASVGLGVVILTALSGFDVLTGAAFSPGQKGAYGWLFGLGMVAVTLQTLLGQALLAAGRLRAFVGLAVSISLLGTGAAAGALALGWPVGTVLLAYLLAQGLTVLPALALAARHGLLPAGLWRGRRSRSARRGLLHFVGTAASVLICSKAVDFAVRTLLVGHYGLAQTDLWQTVVKLSDNYTMVMAVVFNSVFYPRLAALTAQPAAARAYVGAMLRLLAPGLALALGLVYALRDTLLPLLFAPRLLGARELLAPQLLGDWAKFLSWALLFQLLAQARLRQYVGVQVVAAVSYVALLAALVPGRGLPGAVLAYAVHYSLLLAGCLVMHHRMQRQA